MLVDDDIFEISIGNKNTGNKKNKHQIVDWSADLV